MARRVAVTARSEFSWGRETVPPEPPSGEVIEVTFRTTDAGEARIMVVNDGISAEDEIPVAGGGIGEEVILKVSTVPDGTPISLEAREDPGPDPYCENAGQGFTTEFVTDLVITTCPVEGFEYLAETNANFSESGPTAQMTFIPIP